jgi:predicted secreted hydrolase
MLEYKPIQFPLDELPHQNIIEWWYFNGNLVDSAGNQYTFMDCLFKADSKKAKIPFLPRMPFKDVYFSHILLSNTSANKFYSEINPLVFISKDSFSKDLFFVNYTLPSLRGYFNYAIEKIEQNHWYLKSPYFELHLKNKKPPLLVGGKGFLELGASSTYYYSLTDLETTGEIIVDGKRIVVTGQSWMDHQWADAVYSNFGWTWFSLQLKNNTEIICFRFQKDQLAANWASVLDSAGQQKDYQDVELINLNQNWQSLQTGTIYPLAWQIKIPSAELNLEVKPLLREQEMIFGLINYWEGGLIVQGNQAGQAIEGLGFMELVGYPSQKGRLNYYQKMLTRRIKSDLKRFFAK